MIKEARSHNPDFAYLASDLFESSSRKLIITTTIICGVWLLGLASYKSGQISSEILPPMALTCLTFLGSYRLISKKLLAAQILWLTGVLLTITLALVIFQQPDIAFLYALIPLMAVVMIGWQVALIAGALTTGLLLGFAFWPGAGFLPPGQIAPVVFGGILAGFVGWSAFSPFLIMVEWSTENLRRVAQSLEEARNQRMELRQIQEDMLHANNELNRLSIRLKVMTEKAEEARRMKEEFVANVSHELRTPLNMIIGYTDLIMKSPQVYSKRLPARLLADISSIQRNSQHLVDLINDVLDLSQVDAGRMALTKRWTSLQEIIDAAIIAVKPFYETKNLYLRTELPQNEMLIYCDSTRLREVILNLLSNAGRITEQGGVLVGVVEDHDNVVIRVKDTGPGITPEDQVKIFEPFSQLDRMLHHRTGGSGLGLSISKRFIELHDGKMWFESEVGTGTTFYFSIPTGISSQSLAARGGLPRWINRYVEYIPRSRPNKAPSPQYIPRLVVVENERAFQHLFSRYADHVEIVPAESLEMAIQLMKESPAQAVIMNTQAFENDQAFTPAVPLPYNTPVISCWVPGKEEVARRLGVVEYLLKPTRQEDLIAAFDRFNKLELSLLMVEDDPETIQLFARIISANRPDFRVIRASNGREALDLMRARQPEAVLLDLMLPDLDGYQVLREKAADPAISSIPVVIVSANDPVGAQVISSQFAVRRTSGLSVQEFLECVMAIVGTLNSELQKPDPLQPETAPE
jgi:signal transduction histidine kinase/CheY-like chemotaxis protein